MPQATVAADEVPSGDGEKGRVESAKKRGTWVKKSKFKADAAKPEAPKLDSPVQTPKVAGSWNRKGWLPDDEWEAQQREKWAKSQSSSSWNWKDGARWPAQGLPLPALPEPEVFLGDIEGYWGADVWTVLQDPITDTYPPGAGFPWTWPLLGSTLCLGDQDEDEADHAGDAKDAQVAVVLHSAAEDALEGGAGADVAKLPEKSPRPASTVGSTRSSCGSDRGSRLPQRSDLSSGSVKSDDGVSAPSSWFATPRSGSWQASEQCSVQSCATCTSVQCDETASPKVGDVTPSAGCAGEAYARSSSRGFAQ
jgi:hypothetical protein